MLNSSDIGDLSNNQIDEVKSNATGRQDLQSLTGCKKPRNKPVQDLLFGNPIKFAKDQKKYKADVRKYNDCLSAYKQKLSSSTDSSSQGNLKVVQDEINAGKKQLEDAKAEDSKAPTTPDSTTTSTDTTDTSDDKILGMPKKLAYAIGGLIVVVGGFLLYKKLKK